MGLAIYTALVILSLVIQTTVFSMWTFLQVPPDLLIILVVVFSLLNGPKFGAKFGFASGLALDLLAGNFIGLYAVSRMLIGFGIGLISSRLYKENYVVPFISIILATIFEISLHLFGMYFSGFSVSLAFAFKQVLVPSCIYNGILGLLLYVRLFYFNYKIIYWDELFRRAR